MGQGLAAEIGRVKIGVAVEQHQPEGLAPRRAQLAQHRQGAQVIAAHHEGPDALPQHAAR